jgi:hypothetical protein
VKQPGRAFEVLTRPLGTLARFGGDVLQTPGRAVSGIKGFVSTMRSGRVPWLRRYLAYVSAQDCELITFHYSLNGHLIVDDRRDLSQPSEFRLLKSVPAGPMVIQWDNYLIKRLDLIGVSGSELTAAARYQLSLVSPFEPGEICFACKPQAGETGSYRVYNYSHIDEVIGMISSLPAGSFYPTHIHSEAHLWEQSLVQHIEQTELPANDRYLYIVFTDASVKVGMIDSLPWPSRTNRLVVGEDSGWVEHTYNLMLNFLADYSTRYPEAKIYR